MFLERRKKRSVVDEVRPLALFLRLFGLFPARMKEDRLEFSNTSSITLFSHILIFLPLAISYALSNMNSTATKVQLTIYVIQLWVRGLPCVFSFRHLPRLVNLLNRADKIIPIQPKTRPPLLFAGISVAIFIVYVIGAIHFSLNTSSLLYASTRVLVAMIWQRDYQQACLFAFFTLQIQARFASVRGMLSTPERCRLAHGILAECVRTLSKAFGLRLFMSIVAIGCDCLTNVYMHTYHRAMQSTNLLFLSTLDLMSAIYLPARFSTKLVEEGKAIENDILKISSFKRNNLEYARQIDLLLEEVRTSKLEISAWGVFKIDGSIYGSFINTQLTFFIAMAQFSSEIKTMIKRYNLNSE